MSCPIFTVTDLKSIYPRLSIKYLQTKSGLGKDKIQKFVLMIQKKIEEVTSNEGKENVGMNGANGHLEDE